jgi:hypothetical protein
MIKDFSEITKFKLSLMNTSVSLFAYFLIQPFGISQVVISFSLAT